MNPDQIEVVFQPSGRRIEVKQGISVLNAAQQAGVELTAICGGGASCGSCKVILPQNPATTPVTDLELELLEPAEIGKGVRLACQARIHGALTVQVPAESLRQEQRTQVEGKVSLGFSDPVIVVVDLDLESGASSHPQPAWQALIDQLKRLGQLVISDSNLETIRRLPIILSENANKLRAVIKGNKIIRLTAPQVPVFGVAVDIGTTKIAGFLVDLETGETIAQKGIMNPQIAIGEDLMIRISYAVNNEDGSFNLQKRLLDSINVLIGDLCTLVLQNESYQRYHPFASTDQIVEMVVVGNTAMHHFFLGLPVRQLGMAPYLPLLVSAIDIDASDLGLRLKTAAQVHLLPNVAGFVGADHIAMLLAALEERSEEKVLYVDIGTNTEMTFYNNGRMTSCSAASGPAFEGAHIKDGMRAAAGAIEKVYLDSTLTFHYQTVNGALPSGICGSGILDIIAELIKHGILDNKGMLDQQHKLVRRGKKGLEVLIVPKEKTGHGREVVLTRKDIAEIQLAKGAIRAGIELLLKANHTNASAIDSLIIAGAFGTYLDIDNAITIGLFPALPKHKFSQIGNAAGIGARMALLSQAKRNSAKELATKINYLELSNHPEFVTEFARAMMFGQTNNDLIKDSHEQRNNQNSSGKRSVIGV